MAAFNKVNVFTRDTLAAVHNFTSHTFKVMLTNTAPVVGNSVKADITEITAGNGYTAGGLTTAATLTTTSGTAKVTTADVTFAASGGVVGPFRYAVVYNDTQTTPAKPLVGWTDYGSSISLNDGETVKVDFDDTNGLLTIG